jgi:aspartate--ammonia ligase
MELADLHFQPNTGIYTDMNAIRPDDDIDAIHSIYVDQWDWERVMDGSQRNITFLKEIVRRIYQAIKRTEFLVSENYPVCFPRFRRDHVHPYGRRAEGISQPHAAATEHKLAQEYGAIFLMESERNSLMARNTEDALRIMMIGQPPRMTGTSG